MVVQSMTQALPLCPRGHFIMVPIQCSESEHITLESHQSAICRDYISPLEIGYLHALSVVRPQQISNAPCLPNIEIRFALGEKKGNELKASCWYFEAGQ